MNAFKAVFNDWFMRGMLAAICIASFWPTIGKSGGFLHLDAVADYGIALVFFLHGMGIPTEQMRSGLKNWRMHATIQAFTFIVFPLIFLAFNFTLGFLLPPMLLLGFFYLSVLPSTISSSVAITGMARGNVPAAIFNATLSSLLGILLTPLLVSLMVATSGQSLNFGDAVIKIATLLLLPFVLGQLLHPILGSWFLRYRKITTFLDKSVIVLLVFSSFSDSVAAGLWTNYGFSLLIITFIGTSLLLALVLWLTTQAARLLKFSVEDEITTVMCGSKKTLAAGVPMATVLFGANPALGLIVLPIMFYHQTQLVVCSLIAQRYAKRPIASNAFTPSSPD